MTPTAPPRPEPPPPVEPHKPPSAAEALKRLAERRRAQAWRDGPSYRTPEYCL